LAHVAGTGGVTMIEVRCRAEAETIVLELVGEVCLVTAPVVASCIDAALDADVARVVLDLRDVTLFGSTAADVVIEGARRAASGGRSLTIRNTSVLSRYVLELCGLDPLVERSPLTAAS
jgi:anti-anti-sigma factor